MRKLEHGREHEYKLERKYVCATLCLRKCACVLERLCVSTGVCLRPLISKCVCVCFLNVCACARVWECVGVCGHGRPCVAACVRSCLHARAGGKWAGGRAWRVGAWVAGWVGVWVCGCVGM